MLLQPFETFPSLFELSKRVCIRNVDKIDDIGELPYSLVRPILMKLENPAILHTIEKNSPQIAGEDKELWTNFIRRDFGNEAVTKYEPSNPASWHKIYQKHKREQEAKDKEDFGKLKADMQKLKDHRESRQVGLTNTVRMQDIGRLRSVDRGCSMGARSWSMSSRGSRVSKGSGPAHLFKNGTLNKVLTKGMRR